MDGYALLTENVSDFARIAAERLIAGDHHVGILIALSLRFSLRPDGIPKIAAATRSIADEDLQDRLVYLEQSNRPGIQGVVDSPDRILFYSQDSVMVVVALVLPRPVQEASPFMEEL